MITDASLQQCDLDSILVSDDTWRVLALCVTYPFRLSDNFFLSFAITSLGLDFLSLQLLNFVFKSLDFSRVYTIIL